MPIVGYFCYQAIRDITAEKSHLKQQNQQGTMQLW